MSDGRMTFDVEIDDCVRAVTVRRQGALLHVTLDGVTHLVDARVAGASALSMLVASDGGPPTRSVDAAFAEFGASGAVDVHVCGGVVPLQIRRAGSFGQRKREGAAHGAGPQRVVAPMPGRIVRVLVKAGDDVRARQGLVVVEAMKMENELRASRDGRVREVAVVEGQSVEAGAVLVMVD